MTALPSILLVFVRQFVAEAANQGLEIVADEAFTADSNTDFSVQLDKAKDAGAELVFLPIYYQEASIILKQASDKEFAPVFFGCDGMDGILSVENFDTSLAEGLMLLTPFSTTEESSKAFTEAYVAAYGIEPNQFAQIPTMRSTQSRQLLRRQALPLI